MEGELSQPARLARKEMTTFKSGIWQGFEVECRRAVAHNGAMVNAPNATRSHPLAVIMERCALNNRWVSEQWEAKGVVQDLSPAGTPPKVIVHRQEVTQMLYPGH